MKKTALFLIILFVSSCMFLPIEEEPLPPPVIGAFESTAFRFAVVQRDTLQRIIDASAQRIPAHEETLAFTVSRVLIENIYVETGSTVTEGDVIAELDISDLERQLNDAYFTMEQLELRLRQSEETFLLNKKYADVARVDENAFERTVSDLVTRIQILQMDIEKLLSRIEERILRATMSGSITFLRRVSDGDRSVENERFVTITDTSVSVFIITGPNAQFFVPGDTVQMRVSGSQFFDIVVADPHEIGVHNPNENAAYFALTDVPAEFMNARYATVRYVMEEKQDVLFLPGRAIHRVGENAFVYILVDNVRETVPVTTGMEATGGFVEILSGLEEGDYVIMQ